MKRLVLACMLMGSFYQLKAQQLKPKFADSLANAIDRTIKSQTDSWSLFKPDLKGNEALALNSKANYLVSGGAFKSNMPVAVLEGHSKMPVVHLESSDRMPVVIINPTEKTLKQQALPQSPAFKAPAPPFPALQK
jgi:hypothetical protein